jgi:hypothetical protein
MNCLPFQNTWVHLRWGFGGIRVTRSLGLYCMFYRTLFVICFWPLCCLSFFDLRILITPLVSSNFSHCFFLLYCYTMSYLRSTNFALEIINSQNTTTNGGICSQKNVCGTCSQKNVCWTCSQKNVCWTCSQKNVCW